MKRRTKVLRIQEGCIHIYFRGNSRFNVFYDDLERIEFLKKCNISAAKHNTEILEYVLMDNHVHLQVWTENLSDFMKSLLIGYVTWYNKKNGLTDKLFRTPFSSSCKFSEKWIVNSMIYILQNPLKAKICKHPSDYQWSSYHQHYGGKSRLSKFLKINPTYLETYIRTKSELDKSILELETKSPNIGEESGEPRIINYDWARITDGELNAYVNNFLSGKSIHKLTKIEIQILIKRIFNETNASFRQISSITHENYDYVRQICRNF